MRKSTDEDFKGIGQLTISRRSSGAQAADIISVTLEDKASNAAVEVEFTMADFVKALTGQAMMPGNVRRAQDLQHWGKEAVYHHVTIQCDAIYRIDLEKWRDEQIERELEKAMPLGFELAWSSFNNRQQLTITFVKWI